MEEEKKRRKVLHFVQNKNVQKHKLGPHQQESSFGENDLRVLVLKKLDVSQQYTFAATTTNHVPGCISKSTASRLRAVIIPSIWHWKEHIWSILSGFGLSSTRKALRYRREFRTASTKMIRGQEHMAHERRLGDLDSFSTERRRRKGHLIAVFIMSGFGEHRIRLLYRQQIQVALWKTLIRLQGKYSPQLGHSNTR